MITATVIVIDELMAKKQADGNKRCRVGNVCSHWALTVYKPPPPPKKINKIKFKK